MDDCLWNIKKENDDNAEENYGLLSTYVDDILSCAEVGLLRSMYKQLKEIWETTEPEILEPDQRGALRFLGTELEIIPEGENEGILIHQKRYAEDLLKRFNLHKCKGASTPGETNTPNTKIELIEAVETSDKHLINKCRAALGGLI